MTAPRVLVCVVLLLLVTGAACQNNHQSAVQPEKLASSSASTAGPAGSGPLVPFASGHGPGDIEPPTANADPSAETDGIPSPDGEPVAPAPGPAPKAKPTPKAVAGVVKLVKAGNEPHKKLRFTPKVGHESSIEMVMKTAVRMQIDGKKQPEGKVPPIVIQMATKVLEVRKSGDVRYKFDVTAAGVRAIPGVQAKVITALNQQLGSLTGLTGHVVVSDRGITKETKLSMAGKKSAQTQQVLQGMEQAMQQLGAPLPKEPVGKGARWTHTTTLTQNGITLTQVATYDLLQVKGKKLTCKITLDQKAPKQKVVAPGGVTVDLLSLVSSGGGKTKMRLDRLTPLSSKVKVETRARMKLPQGKKMKMTSSLTVEMGKPAKPAKKKKAKAKGKTKAKPKPKPAPAAPAPAPAPAPTTKP